MKDNLRVQAINDIINNNSGKLGGVLTILENIQNKYGYLSEEALKQVSEETGHSLADLYGVATFYKAFSLEPRGKHLVSVCLGTACHVRGAPAVAEEFKTKLGIKPGETTKDRMFTYETVNCLGACALGPVVKVDGHYFSNVRKNDVERIIKMAIEGLDKVEMTTDERIFPVEVSCPKCNHSLMDRVHLVDGQPSISVTISFGQEHGVLRLSSLYGSPATESTVEIGSSETVDFFCPYCHAYLNAASPCSECGAPMVPMIVRDGGVLQICSRNGCKNHMLDLCCENL